MSKYFEEVTKDVLKIEEVVEHVFEDLMSCWNLIGKFRKNKEKLK